jgi:hypothetical protein
MKSDLIQVVKHGEKVYDCDCFLFDYNVLFI